MHLSLGQRRVGHAGMRHRDVANPRGLEERAGKPLDSLGSTRGSREGDAAGKGHGALTGPPVASWVHAWNQLLSGCSSTTAAVGSLRHHPAPRGAGGRLWMGWEGTGWMQGAVRMMRMKEGRSFSRRRAGLPSWAGVGAAPSPPSPRWFHKAPPGFPGCSTPQGPPGAPRPSPPPAYLKAGRRLS